MTTRIINALTAAVTMLVFLIGAGAFVLSYDALHATGTANGIPASKAWIWPLLIDAPLIVFTLAMLVFQIMRESIRLWAGLVILFTAATIIFNVSHAQSTWLGWTVAIVAPVGLLLTTEALRHLAKTIIGRQTTLLSLAELSKELGSLSSQHDTLTGEVDHLAGQRDTLKIELGNLSGQIQEARARLVSLQNDIQGGQIEPKARSVTEMNEARQDKITERRQGVLSLKAEGLSEDDIAAHYGVSVRTIRRDIEALNGQVEVSNV